MDECGVCDGDGSSCQVAMKLDEPNTLWLVDNGDGTYDVGYWSTDDIGGLILMELLLIVLQVVTQHPQVLWYLQEAILF